MNDMFSGLGGLFKGMAGFMPQDDPDFKIMAAQTEIGDLQKQELELYAEIGRSALASGTEYPEYESRINLIQANIAEAKRKLSAAQAEKDAKDSVKRAKEEASTCSNCGSINDEGVKFCQECGTKLGALRCNQCGVNLPPGTRFCGECGAKQV